MVTQFCPLEIPAAVAVINATTFLLGLIFLGRRFAMSTLLSTVLYPLFLNLLQYFFQGPIVRDTLTACASAALLSGLGVGLVIKGGASTGGMDIPAILLNRHTGVPVATILCATDVLVLLGQALTAPAEKVVYGILTALAISAVVNKVIMSGTGQVQVLIISPKYQEIGACICGDMDRGMTLVDISTGYKREQQQAVLSVVTHRDLPTLNAKVLDIDPTAFIVITDAYKVHGKGFTMAR